MADLSQARTALEYHMDMKKGYFGLCESAVGAKDIQVVFADITHSVGAENLSCHASKTAYAVSSKLPSGGYWCLDSKGVSTAASGLATSTSCK